jgi:hypothetical protein
MIWTSSERGHATDKGTCRIVDLVGCGIGGKIKKGRSYPEEPGSFRLEGGSQSSGPSLKI